jgi:hypothetical protein
MTFVSHSNLFHDMRRCGVCRVACGEYSMQIEMGEAELEKRSCRFGRIPLTPELTVQTIANPPLMTLNV